LRRGARAEPGLVAEFTWK